MDPYVYMYLRGEVRHRRGGDLLLELRMELCAVHGVGVSSSSSSTSSTTSSTTTSTTTTANTTTTTTTTTTNNNNNNNPYLRVVHQGAQHIERIPQPVPVVVPRLVQHRTDPACAGKEVGGERSAKQRSEGRHI